MEAKFTKGEWHPVEYAGMWGIQDAPVYESNSLLDADGVGEEEAKANITLACAAPDMFRALEKIIEMNRMNAKDQYGDAEKAEGWACVFVARAALSKATTVK